MKRCGKCKQLLDDSNFGHTTQTKSGLRCYCHECERQRNLDSRQKDPEDFNKRKKYYTNRSGIDIYCQRALGAKRDNKRYKVTITTAELRDIAIKTEVCPICGGTLDYSRGKGTILDNSPSLDRKNNEDVLTKDNVWIICNKCNRSKSNRTIKEFIDYCQMVASKLIA